MNASEAPFTIVPFSTGYTAQVIDLILPIQREEFGVAITAEDQPDLRVIPDFYQQGAGNFWVALAEGAAGAAVVGTIALLDISVAGTPGLGALRKMFVAADWRGRGVSQALLATLIAWARERGMRAIVLGTTDKYLAAHRFYEKHGFVAVHKADLPPSFPIMAVDSKFYRYELADAQSYDVRRRHIALMQTTLATIANLAAMVGAGDWATLRDGGDGWTALEVLGHLRDFDRIFRERAMRMLGEDYPALPAYDHEAMAIDLRYNDEEPAALLDALRESRARTVAFFKGLNDAQWRRAGVHPERGHFSLTDAVIQVGAHDATHIEQLTKIMRQPFDR